MGLLDLFRRKRTEGNFPENELEKTLMQATTDSSKRKDFYMKLLWNDLIVLTTKHDKEGTHVLEENTTVQFVNFEDGKIPIFTSTNRIFDKAIVKDEVPFMALKGKDLFKIARGATFILNPYSDYGKELIPNEIEKLLNGSIFNETNEFKIEEDTQVQIGQPAEYPVALVKALKQFFREKKTVRAAYLAAVKMDKSNDQPHIMIAIDMDGDMKSITNEAGPIAEKYHQNQAVDFLQIEHSNNGISEYFLKETKAFYKRK
ncbi:enhanced serine sensitivity protein SseB C-terminal domain-containing protein [Salinimicrobium xinjiangense]|uniref:enhanced serine sensitivity protein SseB C-terminal domain-containing protein n=1 Tax=Salinimicrobium xinjiangense TaxID=438596 RepID=UPI0004042E25|nr:enhanced serine sensitivity protein SseB C-terminal domain-containing protein [Salinimicrobium xinjiangense]